MNSKERVLAAITHQIPDVVPVAPFIGHYAAKFAGVSLRDYVTNGKKLADSQYALWQELGQDIVVTAADAYYITQGFGMEVDFYDDALPTAKKSPISSLKEIDRLRIPDPYCDGRMPVYLEAAELLKARLGNEVAVRGTGTGPFSIAAYLLGNQDFLMKLADISMGEAEEDEELLMRQLLDLTTETTLAFLSAQVKLGVDIIYMGDSLASCDMISPAMYEEWVFPYHKRIYTELKKQCRAYGSHTMLHICGNNTRTLTRFADSGTELIEIDFKMNLAECAKKLKGKVAMIGNVNPAGILLNGTAEMVKDASRRCIEDAKGCGFILGTGCFVPLYTPFENLKAMVDAAHCE